MNNRNVCILIGIIMVIIIGIIGIICSGNMDKNIVNENIKVNNSNVVRSNGRNLHIDIICIDGHRYVIFGYDIEQMTEYDSTLKKVVPVKCYD